MKVLNLDAFVTPKRFLKIGGIEYGVRETSVQDFVDAMAAAEVLEKGGELTPRQSFESSLKLIKNSIPELPEAVIASLPLEAVVTVLKFIRGELDNGLPAGTEGPGALASGESKS